MAVRPERDPEPGPARARDVGLSIAGAIRALGRRFHHDRDVAVCALIATIVSCAALDRMGLLSPANQQDVLPVDSARTAYVAKSIADGKGYTTNVLPTSLVSYYDRVGKLHDERWINADRFPFAAYAIAALYLTTGRRDAWTGVIAYNLVAFVAFLTALYVFSRRVTGSQAGGALAVALALLHGHTYVFLWMKDADMLLLSVLTMSCFHGYFGKPLAARSTLQMAWFGTVLAWSFLSRPNVGAPFLVALALVSLVQLWMGMRDLGAVRAWRYWLRSDAIAGVVATLWVFPYLVHTVREWGIPFFSVNGLYQPILSTRFGMGTDTWWRYLPKDFDYSVAHLWREARSEVIEKFVTSWRATQRTFTAAYFLEMALAFSAIHLRRGAAHHAGEVSGSPGLGGTAIVVLVCFAFNFAVLPLYSYRFYSWRHYLGFVLPLLWVAATYTVLRVVAWFSSAREPGHSSLLLRAAVLILVGAVVAASLQAPGNDGNLLAMSIANFWEWRPRTAAIALGAVLLIPLCGRRSSATWLLIFSTVALVASYRPHLGHKSFTHIFVPASDRVWTELRQRHGLVGAFALQALVPWNTDRKTIMAPEFVMNLYEMNRAHRLEFEDIYVESPEAALHPAENLFSRAAPGFEGYLRIVKYRGHLPGYRVSFHQETKVGNPSYGIPEWPKSSTIYTLADRTALAQVFRTPTAITIGDEASVVHTAHGFGGYYRIDGKPTVAATDATRRRYVPPFERPWEDTSVTFFVDTTVPSRVTIQLYAVAQNVFTFYWNLDLDEYTPVLERARHQIGEAAVTTPGWQTVTLDVPRALIRRGLNKLGFRAETFAVAALCGTATPEPLCPVSAGESRASVLIRADTVEPNEVVHLSMFLHRLDFDTVP